LADTASPIKLQQPKGTALINLAVTGLIVTALYFAREILVPVALAVLFSFVLAPFVIRLQSWRVPRTLSVLVAVFVGFSIIFSLGGLMVSQANRLAEELPGYQQTLREKIQGLRGVAAGGVSTRGGGGFGRGGRAMLGPGAGRTSIGGGSGATCWLTTGGLSPGWGAGSGTEGGRGAVIFALGDG